MRRGFRAIYITIEKQLSLALLKVDVVPCMTTRCDRILRSAIKLLERRLRGCSSEAQTCWVSLPTTRATRRMRPMERSRSRVRSSTTCRAELVVCRQIKSLRACSRRDPKLRLRPSAGREEFEVRFPLELRARAMFARSHWVLTITIVPVCASSVSRRSRARARAAGVALTERKMRASAASAARSRPSTRIRARLSLKVQPHPATGADAVVLGDLGCCEYRGSCNGWATSGVLPSCKLLRARLMQVPSCTQQRAGVTSDVRLQKNLKKHLRQVRHLALGATPSWKTSKRR